MKRFIVRKYVMAESVIDALKKEKKQDADDIWVDKDWEDNKEKDLGFKEKK